MKKLIALLGLLAFPSLSFAAGNSNPLVVSSGSFKSIDLYDNASGGARQAIVIGDFSSSTTVRIDPITGMNVHLSSGGSSIGSVIQGTPGTQDWPVRLTSTTILGTVTVDGSGVTQPVSGTFFQATQPISGTVTAGQGTAGTTDWPVRVSTVVVNQGTAGTTDWPVRVGSTTVTQGPAGTTDWPVRLSTTVAAIQIQQSGGSLAGVGYQTNGGSIPVNVLNTVNVTGSLSASSVNVTTAAANTALPIAMQVIGGVGPTGLTQGFAVDLSSRSLVVISTGGVTAAQGGTWTIQPGNTPNTTDWRVTMATNTVIVSTGGVTAAQGGTWTVQPGNTANLTDWRVTMATNTVIVSTGGLTAAQGGTWTVQPGNTPNTTDWRVTMATNTVIVSTGGVTAAQGGTWTVQPGNTANTTPWLIDDVTPLSINSIAGSTLTVGYQTGQSSIPVNVLNTVAVSGSFSATYTNIATSTYNQSFPAIGNAVSFTGPTGLTQAGRVDISSNQIVVGTMSDNGAASATNRVGTVSGIYQTDYNNGTAGTQGRDSAQDHGTDGLLWVANLPAMRPASFSASTNTYTLAANPTDVSMLCGNASNTVLLYAMRVSCVETTAAIVPISIFKRSSADIGSYSTMTVTAMDSSMNLYISSASLFFSNPTVGTAVGQLDNYNLGCMTTGTASPNDIYMSPSDWRMKPVVLRGTSQCVAVNFNGTAMTGSKVSVSYSWIETKTISP